ncbi:MAG: SDR family oxidoreductase [Rhodocyclaceae bacterium]|nr:SDR family oxidoreductase [Rhodocyclaceae bacterium]
MTTQTLGGQVAIVTGATAYIGKAICARLAQSGAQVIVSGRNAEAGAGVVAEIEKAGGQARFERADLMVPGELDALAARVSERYGRIDILVASGAGASHDSPSFRFFKDMELAHFEAYIRAHWLTRLYAIRAVHPHMVKAGGGRIVAIGTDAGRVATVGESMIGGSTAGMMQMCRALSREFGRDKIRVNMVSMSYISDAEPRWEPGSPSLMTKPGGGGMLDALKRRMLFDVQCRDIANAVAFLAGPESAAITGQTLSVNGGLSTLG